MKQKTHQTFDRGCGAESRLQSHSVFLIQYGDSDAVDLL